MSATVDAVATLTENFNRARGMDIPSPLEPGSAVCQDALIYGIDVDDYVAGLEAAFGPAVRDIPWLLFTDQTASFRGCAVVLFPLWLLGRIPAWGHGDPLIPPPDPRGFAERLTLDHVARVIDAGRWIDA